MSVRLMTFFILLLNASHCFPQNNSIKYLDSVTDHFINILKSKGIDSIIVYKNYFPGQTQLIKNEEDRCDASVLMDVYILWNKSGQSWLTRKNNCFNFSTIQINMTAIWSDLLIWRQIIKKEFVKQFQYIYIDSGQQKLGYMMTYHSLIREAKIILDSDNTSIYINSFDMLREEENGDKERNINYSYNSTLKSRYLMDEIDELVKDATSRRPLSKIRRMD